MSHKTNPASLPDEFQKVIDILTVIQNKIDQETDVVRTGFNTPEELSSYFTAYIENLKSGDDDTLSMAYVNFLPTGLYQELSISNGWGDEYIELANQFDAAYKKIRG